MAESDAMLDAGLNRGECDRHDVPPAPSVVLGRVEGVTTPPRGPSPGPPPPPVGPCAEECLVGEEGVAKGEGEVVVGVALLGLVRGRVRSWSWLFRGPRTPVDRSGERRTEGRGGVRVGVMVLPEAPADIDMDMDMEVEVEADMDDVLVRRFRARSWAKVRCSSSSCSSSSSSSSLYTSWAGRKVVVVVVVDEAWGTSSFSGRALSGVSASARLDRLMS